MAKENIIIGVIVVLVAAGYHFATVTPPDLGMTQVSPTLYVDLLSLLMGLCGIFCLGKGIMLAVINAQATRDEKISEKVRVEHKPQEARSKQKNWLVTRSIASIFIASVYIFAMYYIGFLVASFFAGMGLLYTMGSRNIAALIFVPLAAAFLMYVMFGLILNILLPLGIFFT